MVQGRAGATDRFGRKREAILDAATALLNRRGVKGLTLGATAKAVGLSATSVTYYFPRKDDLAAACMARGIEALSGLFETALAETGPEDRLTRLIGVYLARVRQGLTGEECPLPVLSDLRALGQPQRGPVGEAYLQMFRRARQLFEAPELAWLTRGRRTARTHLLLEQLFWAAAWIVPYPPADDLVVQARMCDVLLGGLAAAGSAWRPLPIPLAQLRPRGRQQVSRETFLLAATRLINARGYRGASVEKISAALKVTKGSFYHHLDAKDDLVIACFDRTFEVMGRVQGLAAELPGDAWTKLSSAAAAVVEYQLSDQGPLLRAAALASLPEAIRAEMVARTDRVSEGFAAMIAKGAAEGSIRPVDPFVAARMLHATLNAGGELAHWAPGVTPKAAPAVFARPLLMGIFRP